MRNVDLTVNRVTTGAMPSSRPMPMATGRLRPGRDAGAGSVLAGSVLAGSVLAGSGVADSASPLGGGGGWVAPGESERRGGFVSSVREKSTSGPGSWRSKLDLEEFGFLVFEQLVDLRHIAVGEIFEFALSPAYVVLARVAVLDQLVEGVLGMPPDIADGDAAVLGLMPGHLHEFLAALLGKLGENDPDDRAVAGRIDAQVAIADGLLDGGQRRLVEGLDHHHARLGNVERGQLIDRCRGAVVLGRDLGEH